MDALLRRRAMIAAGGGSPTPPGPVIEPVFYDYLVFDGAAKIDTTVTLPSLFSIRCPLGKETRKQAQRVFRAQGGDGYFQFIYNSNTTSTKRTMAVYYDSASATGTWELNFSYDVYLFITPFLFGSWETSKTNTKGSAHPTGGLTIGGWETGNPFSGKIGTIRIYGSDAQSATKYSDLDNYTPVATLRPCTYNGEAGYWYVEGNIFFGNTAGSGSLSATNTF